MTEALQIPTSAHDEQSSELDWHTRRSRMAQTASKNCRRATRASVSVRWSQAPGRSDRARGPIIASALWIRGTVEHFARAAIRGFGSSGEITATATRLTGIRRLLRVMAQFALS